MYYALLIYQKEGLFEALSDSERADILQHHYQLQQDTKASGAFVATSKLAPASTAKTVNKEGASTFITDGPYAETREVLAGFYMFNCQSYEEAEAYARRIPHIESGRVEIRPVAFADTTELQVSG